MLNKKYGLLDDEGIVLDAVRANDEEEARELFILLHSFDVVSRYKVARITMLYHNRDGSINGESYFN